MPKIIFQDGWNRAGGLQTYSNDNPERFMGGYYTDEGPVEDLIKSIRDEPNGNTRRARDLWTYIAKVNIGKPGDRDIEVSMGPHQDNAPHFDVRYNDGSGYRTYHFYFNDQIGEVTYITE